MDKKIIFDKKNIIVTGGAGFIGSHLCDELVKHSKVICIDNFVSGQQTNIDHLLRNPNFIFIKHDINQPIDLENIFELKRFGIKFQGIQEIYNFAAPTSPQNFKAVIIDTLLTNTVGIKNMLDIAVKYNAKFLQASSAVVYGGRIDDELLFDEEYVGTLDQFSERSAYDLGKKMAESFVYNYSKMYGIKTALIRIFRTYGPRMELEQGHLIPDFIMNALDNKNLTVYGTEDFTTSLIYVTDVVDATIKIMNNEKEFGPINVGSDINIKIISVCEKIIELSESKSKINFEDSLLFLTELGLPNINKALNKLGWMPVISLNLGLQKTIEYAKAHNSLLKYS